MTLPQKPRHPPSSLAKSGKYFLCLIYIYLTEGKSLKKNTLMKTFFALAGLLFCAIETSATPVPNPTDAILVAYRLTPAQQDSFSTTDNKISTFWTADWSGRDYIDMNTSDTFSVPGHNQWQGSGDCEMWVKAGADSMGLYLYFKVHDNVFVDSLMYDSSVDCMETFIDLRPSSDMANLTPDQLAMPQFPWAITITSQQFEAWMGPSKTPGRIRYSNYDPLFLAWTPSIEQLPDLPAIYNGMSIEMVTLSSSEKVQEWFIPWNYIGTQGVPMGDPLVDRRFAFTCGYNDKDNLTGPEKCIRWKKSDPFSSNESISMNAQAWGDIYVQSDCCDPYITNRFKPAIKNKILKKLYFDISGRQVTSYEAGLSHTTVFIERKIFADGSVEINKTTVR
jgi:hypothetical protein